MKSKIILLIEDEQDLAELIAFNLEKEGFRPHIAADGLIGLEAALENPPDLILLDLMLPSLNGTEICKILKKNEKTTAIPIIMLTAKGEEIDRVVGFEVGADDYMVKPFSIRELMLRVKALLRRALPEQVKKKVIQVGLIHIDSESHHVSVAGREILLTTIEYKLLSDLAERVGRVQSRETLLQNVWGYNYVGDSRTVDTHITRLRNKLGEAGDIIKTVRGFGYKMEE